MMNNLGSDDNIIVYGFPNTGKSTLKEKSNILRIFDTDDAPDIFADGLLTVESFRVNLVKLMLDFQVPRIILSNLPTVLDLSDNYEYFAFLPNIADLMKNRHIPALGLPTVCGWYIDAIRKIRMSFRQNNNNIRLFITNGYYINDVISFNAINEFMYNDFHKVRSNEIDVLDALEERAVDILVGYYL